MPPAPPCRPSDGDRAALFRAVAVVVKGDSAPHVYTLYADGSPAELPDDHLHGPLFPDLDEGIDLFAKALAEHFTAGDRIGIDHQTPRDVAWPAGFRLG